MALRVRCLHACLDGSVYDQGVSISISASLGQDTEAPIGHELLFLFATI